MQLCWINGLDKLCQNRVLVKSTWPIYNDSIQNCINLVIPLRLPGVTAWQLIKADVLMLSSWLFKSDRKRRISQCIERKMQYWGAEHSSTGRTTPLMVRWFPVRIRGFRLIFDFLLFENACRNLVDGCFLCIIAMRKFLYAYIFI